ncbi:hypothetical protein ACQ4PT_015125 [Festuca glaucescens]
MAAVWRLSVDDAVAAVVPIVVYWAYSGVHMALGHARAMEKYRLNSKDEEDNKNMVSKRAVLANVLMQHAMQLAAVALLTLTGGGRGGATATTTTTSYLTAARQIAVAVVVFDAYRYAWHRLAHRNRFIYRHLHSWHHRIVVPYAFGAIYGHPLEALIADTAGGSLAILASGLPSSPPGATAVFLTLCTVQGIDNHCGLCLLPRGLRSVWNGAAHHGVHHLPRGVRHNFSDLFFVTWDRVFGTHLPYAVVERSGGEGLMLTPMPPTASSKNK